MNQIKLASALVATLLLGGIALPAQAQEEIKLTVASGLPAASGGTKQLAEFFGPEIDRRLAETGNYKIVWTTAWGGSIAGQQDMLEAVQDQIVDIGYVNTVFEGSKLPLAQINFVTPFGSNDLVKVLSIYDQLRSEIPQIDEAFLQNGQRLLATTGIRDFHLLSTFPINKVSDLKGRKIGAPGLSATWLDGTGAVAVSGSLSQYYNSLKTGVYDGILTFESAIAPFKFYEVAPIITKVGFGSLLSSAVTINEARWQSLPEEVQDAILDVSHEYQELVGEKVTAASQKSLDTAAAKGAEINVLAPEEVQKLVHSMPNLALNWAKNIDAKGLPGTGIINAYMKLSREAGITFVRDWDKE